MSSTQKPTCFVIAPIGPKDSDVRKRSDKVLKHIFRKALAEKYDVIRGDEIDEPGMITSQVLRAVQESSLVVADLTGHNPNVLYELAVRHAIEKPVIHSIEPKLSKIPFDIAGFRTIEFDLTDPDSIESAVEQLKKQTEQAEKGKWGETPVKLANIMSRSNADSQETVLLKEAVQSVARLQSNLFELTSDLAARIDRVQSAVGASVYSAATGSLVSPSILKGLLPNLGYGGGSFGIGSHGSEIFQPQTVLEGTSEKLAAQTLIRTASQPDEVPPAKLPDTAATLLKKRRPEDQVSKK